VALEDGPLYLFRNQDKIVIDHLISEDGGSYRHRVGIALCRCGQSKDKPFCDGSHVAAGFCSARCADDSKDRRKDYCGANITIHDNRMLCAHAETCIKSLPSVFRKDGRPWIDPDGAEVESIIATVKKCPSGALSYSIGGVEHRDPEHERAPLITVQKGGPLCVTGSIELHDAPWGDGASKEHYALCRCGGSMNKPFCDGSHWHCKIKDE
jgi:CDGSH-type Zn-finger protein